MGGERRADRAAARPASRPRPAPDLEAISRLPIDAVYPRLEAMRRPPVLAVIEFLTRPREMLPLVETVETLAALLLATGLPLDRYGSSTTMITSDHDAVGRVWRRHQGVEQSVFVSDDDEREHIAGPFYETAQTRRWLELWLPETPDTRFPIVAELKAQGLTHYLCVPIRLSNAADGWITFATAHPAGFSEQDLLTLAFILPVLACRIDSRVGWTSLDKLLRTYVGDEPHTAILAGRAKRGQVTAIEAAMLVADLRDSTGHTANHTALEAVDLFNQLFDCLVPPIETRRGEVLKYLGDGLLGMFRDPDGAALACDRAFEAAKASFAAIAARNAARPTSRPLEIGIALHFGEIAYGNVGSGSRLDFTVIGRDVALATRIAGMNARLGQPLLMSAAFAARTTRSTLRIGLFPVRGFAESVEVFAPDRVQAAAAERAVLP